MGLQYMPLYVGDYLGDTLHLTCEQHGAYLKLLMCLWKSGGRLPCDRLKIARMVGVTPARWDRMAPTIMAFFVVADGLFGSARLDAELAHSDSVIDQKSRAGESGRATKRLKNNNTALAIHNHNQNHLFEDPISPLPKSPKQAGEEIWAASPTAAKRRSSQAQLTRALEAALNRRKNLAVICQAVAAYYADPEKAKEGHKYAKGVHRVVQDDYWEAWAPGDVEHLPDPEFQAHVWRTWMRDWLESPGQWREYERGPRPDAPGCRIPAEIIAEFQPKTATGRP